MKDLKIEGIYEATLVSKVVNGLPKRCMTFISNWSNVNSEDQNLSVLLPRLMAEGLLHLHSKRPDTGVALVGEQNGNYKTI